MRPSSIVLQEDSMSGIPQTKILSKLSRRRTWKSFLIVGSATFFCLSLMWPLTTKSWRSESEISLMLTKRLNAGGEFKALLDEVVKRHTSIDSITRTLDQNGMGVQAEQITTEQIARKVRQRLKVVLVDKSVNPDQLKVRVVSKVRLPKKRITSSTCWQRRLPGIL